MAWQVGETLLHQVQFEEDEGEESGPRYEILLALQELLTNVFRHGYEESETPVVHVIFEADEHEFSFEIRDRASPFDPTAGLDPRRCDDGDAMPADEGGFGIMIVRAVMDDFVYEHEDGWNVIRATKQVGASVGAGASERPS